MREPTEMEISVASVLYEATNASYVGPMENNKATVDGLVDFVLLARAAIRAMREPTGEMLKYCLDNPDWYGGLQGHHKDEERAGQELWTAMIDAASPLD